MAYTTIDDPSAHFQVTTWTGDGSSPRTITNGGNSNLQPDLVWHKNRSDSGRSHYIHDSTRGFGAHNELVPNSNTNENSDSHLTNNHGYIASASTDSFVLGAGATNDNYTNKSSSTYVAWQWKANGGTTTTNDASATSVGSVDSVYQANTTSGFSIVTYTGTGSGDITLAHGLGKVPEWVIIKDRDGGSYPHWNVWHPGYQPDTTHLNYQLYLELTNQANNAGWTRADSGMTTNLFCIPRYQYNETGKTYDEMYGSDGK